MNILQNLSANTGKKVSFGYNYDTHRIITRKALEYVPELTNKGGAIAQYLSNGLIRENFLKSSTIMQELAMHNDRKFAGESLNKLAINYQAFRALVQKAEPDNGNLVKKFVNELADSSMLPDLLNSETGFLTNRHFYFKPDSKGRGRKSFGFSTNENNAFNAYLTHINRMFQHKQNAVDVSREAGMAIHFLQDMTVPLHTRKQSFLGKVVDFFMHKNFETGILVNQEKLAQNYTPGFKKLEKSLGEKHNNHFDLFLSNVDFSSKKNLQINRNNKKEWARIQQTIFNRAVDSTVLELKNIAREFSKTN